MTFDFRFAVLAVFNLVTLDVTKYVCQNSCGYSYFNSGELLCFGDYASENQSTG
ncbi:hypothetical protein COO91_00449 [Nostoc flagelliforme CCNUN1]|uniref:Uncharacterized protein n=1 Tax=Nostoc flagelliforme CCNUN1 TaxID=2038116 RepID=A0A2K8SGX9_9NOSO|nr:hypothetical protein COO91_00449 [Nostoc flagelliforme CCNUN1]